MARARMLSGSISTDAKVQQLPTPAKLLFTWMIPHADNCGRMRASSALIKALILPHEDCSEAEIETWLATMHDLGLIHLYTHDGGQFLTISAWSKHQRLDRQNRSDLPAPTNWQPPVTSGNQWKPVVARREVKRSEEKGSEVEVQPDEWYSSSNSPEACQAKNGSLPGSEPSPTHKNTATTRARPQDGALRSGYVYWMGSWRTPSEASHLGWQSDPES